MHRLYAAVSLKSSILLFMAALFMLPPAFSPAQTTPQAEPASLAMLAIGSAIAIDQQVTALEGPKTGLVVTGDVIFRDELIETGPGATAEFRFADETVFAMSENSRIILDEFVYDAGAKDIGKLAVTAVIGSFRFISGNVPKQNIAINTPQGTIGVRGTAFDLYVAEDGESHVGLLEGEVRVCNRGRAACRDLRNTGRFLRLDARGQMDELSDWKVGVLRGVAFERAFPFIANQGRVQPAFRYANATIGRFADLVELGGVPKGRILRNAAGRLPDRVLDRAKDLGTKTLKGTKAVTKKAVKKSGSIVRKTGNALKGAVRKTFRRISN